VKFTPNQPFETEKPTVTVDAGLPIGSHRFQLVVVGASGSKSTAVEVTVTVARIIVGGPIPPVITRPIIQPD
jgi:hypothetical protein